jgi:hypothetical protein
MIFPAFHAPMEDKYVVGSLLAVLLTAMVLGTAASGVMVGSHFVAGVEPKQPATMGGRGMIRQLSPAAESLVVSAIWCSDASATYCVPIGGATVLVTNLAGAFVASGRTNALGLAEFALNAPATYKVDVDIENVSAFGYMASHEYSVTQAVAGNSATIVFEYDQPGPNVF